MIVEHKMNMQELNRRQRDEKQKLKEQKEQLMEEWGFQNEETKRMFEARFAKRHKTKKKNLTAEEKYQRFLMIKGKH